MRTAFVAIAMLMTSGAAAATSNCIAVKNDLDRLACYDKEAGRTPTISSVKSSGKWRVHTETSKLTDQPTVIMSVESDEMVNCGWNRGGKIGLVVRCMENRTVLYFNTGCHMASSDYSDYGDITYRIDQEKARTVSGDASTDNRALGLWSGPKAIPIIKQMMGKSSLVARMTPYSESPFTATFDIFGFEAAAVPLREACGW